MKLPCVVTIASADSSGGAGIQADIKAISATGAYAASIIVALTAQNTLGVESIHGISPEFVQQQLNAVFGDLPFQAVKIGMLFDRKIIDLVKTSLEKFSLKNIVLDPVIISKSGCELLPAENIKYLQENLFSLVNLITPNLPEAEKLINIKITDNSQMENAAFHLGRQYSTNVLIKGGHHNNLAASDVLYIYEKDKHFWFHAKRVETLNTHGTGCTLSSAIASYLAQGYSLLESVGTAKKYLTSAIESGSRFDWGQGHGPVDHFYALHPRGAKIDF